MPLTQGQVIHQRYRIVRLLGQGGFGAVYRAWDMTLEHPCAVKESLELSPEGQRQFLREARILARLSHPNLPRVSDYFTLSGQGQYLVMDFVEGQDLEALRTQAGGRLPEAQVLLWIDQVCEALEYLHNQQPAVIHRDIKPANIKITPPDKNYPHGRAILVDFGVAKVHDPTLRTTLGARAVTPGYSPHEQYGQTQAATDARSDVYALGATLYTLLTGQEPPESILRMVSDPLMPPRQIVTDISIEVEAAILQALQMDPGKRFQEVVEFKAAINQPDQPAGGLPQGTQSAAGTPGPQTSATARVPLPRPTRRIPWMWLGVGAGLVVGLAALAILVGWLIREAGQTSLTQTAQANGMQTAAAVAAVGTVTPTMTPSPTIILPTGTSTPSLTTTRTSTPAPSVTPTRTRIPMLQLTSTPLGGSSGLVAFVSDRDGNYEIYVMNADGSGLTRLTNNTATDYLPAWSADGRQIAFQSNRDGNFEIYRMNADGSGVANLTAHTAEDYFPAWSPDNRQIAFVSFRDGNEEIYLMYADGSGVIRLTDNAGNDINPAWSPDGQQIAFSSDRDGYVDIYRMNVDGSGVTRLTVNEANDYSPAWSPDGRQITFHSNRDGNYEIYVMFTDGSEVTRLTDNAANDLAPVWSPDGRLIAFASDRDGNWEIYWINADGSGVTRMTVNEAEDRWPAWAP